MTKVMNSIGTIFQKIVQKGLPLTVTLLIFGAVVVPGAMFAIDIDGDGDLPEPDCSMPTTEAGIRDVRDRLSRWNWDLEGGSHTIRNNDPDCAWPVALMSFKVFDAENPQNGQEMFDIDSVVLQPGETRVFQVDVPDCRYQLDSVIFPGTGYTSAKLIRGQIRFGLDVCSTTPDPEPDPDPDPTPDPDPDPTPEAPACPFDSSDGVVVKFSTQNDPKFLLSTNPDKHRITKSASLPAGTYTVKTFSWDGSEIRESQTQLHEQWNVEVLNGSDALLDSVGPTTDLIDQVLEDSKTNVFTNALTIGEAGAKVSAVHAFPQDISTPNSVLPVCAAFKVHEETPNTTLTVIKNVINDNEGIKTKYDFNLYVNDVQVVTDEINEVEPGTYTVREDVDPDYTSGYWGGDCASDGTVTLQEGDNAVCTITNNDKPVIIPQNPTLTLIKNVINDDGGTASEYDFDLFVNDTLVITEVANEFEPGDYTVHETNLPGYTAGLWGGDCNPDGTITLARGDNAVCTITNNDREINQNKATLTLVKIVNNDNGGDAEVSDFELFVNQTRVYSGIANEFIPGNYTASELNLDGYTASAWGGDCGADGTITLLGGDNKTCTITNDDDPGHFDVAYLTLIKEVVNNDGGTATTSDFALFVGDEQVISEEKNQFTPGDYTVSEINLPGYTAGLWGGDCNSDGTITLEDGDDKVCVITNDDDADVNEPAYITVIKNLINDDGGTATTSDFLLFVNDTQVISEETNEFTPGEYIISEQNLPGYTAGSWGGDCQPDGSLTLNPGDDVVCTITNNDNGGGSNGDDERIIVRKEVTPGSNDQVEFTFNATWGDFTLKHGQEHDSGDLNEGEHYSVVENVVGGWNLQSISCVSDNPEREGNIGNDDIVLSDGETVTCTFVNDEPSDGGGGGCSGSCGGGSHRRPNVVLFSNPSVLGSTISLTQIPYTGLGTSILQIVLFLIGLVAIAGGATYMIVHRRKESSYASMPKKQTNFAVEEDEPMYEESVMDGSMYDDIEDDFSLGGEYEALEEMEQAEEADAPQNLPVAPAVPVANIVAHSRAQQMVAQRKEETSKKVSVARLQDAARGHQAIISEDGIKLITSSAENDEEKSLERLNQVIEAAKTRYPREDGWLILDLQRVREALFISILSMVPVFIEWIVRGEDKKVFSFLRMLSSQKQPVADFVRKVVAQLDNAHRARLEGDTNGVQVDPHVAEVTYHLSNRDLEAIVSELLHGVDERYDSAYTSVRLALVRVLDILKTRNITRIGGAYEYSNDQEAVS